jgi:hypothetical protein
MSEIPQSAKDAFETANEMMDSIRTIKGEPYAHTVEVALITIKIRDLMGALLVSLEEAEVMSEESAEKVYDLLGHMSARLIGLTRMCWNQSEPTKTEADEIMNWADRLREMEDRGANEILKQMGDKDD